MNKLLSSIGIIVSRDIKARIRQNLVTPSSKSKGTTLVKSAKLVNSIRYAVSGDQIKVGTDVPYGKIHHTGGTIRPSRAKYLAIPLTKEAAANKPREWTGTWIAKGCIMHLGKDGKPEALYALKKQVTIPARPYMFVGPQTMKSISDLVRDYASIRLKGAK